MAKRSKKKKSKKRGKKLLKKRKLNSKKKKSLKKRKITRKKVSKETNFPIIGIGAGNHVDGQVLVLHDLLGLTHEFNPRFLRRYMDLNKTVKSAIKKYVGDIKSHDFPNKNELY